MRERGNKGLNDVAHERAVWKVEHWGWGIFGLILLSALLGLFGDGPLARATARNAALSVEYNRFVRYQAPSLLKVHLAATGTASIPALSVSKDFIERVEVQHVTPEPERVKVSREALIFIFNVVRTNEPATIMIAFKPDAYGKTPIKIGLVDGPELQLTQFFYP